MSNSIIPLTATSSAQSRRQAWLWSFFGLYVLTWLVLPLATNDTLNRDTIQIVYWGREWQMGYFKHPPLTSWLAEILTLVFGPKDAVFYLASQAIILASFFTIHRLARLYLAPWPSFMAVTALTVIGYYSYTVPNLNHNILLDLPWSLTILLTYHAIEARRPWAWPGLGLCLGIGILAKYTIIILAPLILAYIVIESRHRHLLAQPGPWLAAAVCGLVISPHLLWLAHNNFSSLLYLADSAGLKPHIPIYQHLAAPLVSLAKMLGMCSSLLLLLGGALGLPRWRGYTLASRDRLLLTMTAGPIVIVLVLAFLTGGKIRVEWATPFFLPLPVLLLRLFCPNPSATQISRFLVWLTGLSAAMAATYILIFSGTTTLIEEAEWSLFPAHRLARTVAESWATTCNGAVPVIIGDSWLAGTASYLLPGQPRVYTEADPHMSPWLSDQDIRKTGAVIVWNKGHPEQFHDLDHQDEETEMPGWFPGLEKLESRFGRIVLLPEVILPYRGHTTLSPVLLGLAVVPPERSCR